MNRKEAIKRIGLTMGCAVSSSVVTGILSGCESANRSDYQLKTLNESQNRMVIILTELIIPATDTPGAKAAKVNQFVDLMLNRHLENKEKETFLGGLDQLNKHSKEMFGNIFTDITKEHQEELLGKLDKGELTLKQNFNSNNSFFSLLKELTIYGYYTSEIGASQELKYVHTAGRYDGNIPYEEIGKAYF